ncbi:uncharacterized protein LOC128252336 [Drosophila gunungcola]|uniref:uncharacterized protein LOC128252336 n=1 Tax=Drosophila gunungcola TaxID=103775 RepID=UPI0022E00F1D|nr:uncharacterized protein LOC128252336 [Drosophila gunungcola]XP_052835941.1 uncharacterized protein LOC128252336 [Drosophila gunungcola]
MSQGTEPDKAPDLKPRAQPTTGSFLCLHTSPPLHIALHGMSALINSRLSKTAFDLCLELLEAGVNAQALAQVVLHVLDVKSKTHND